MEPDINEVDEVTQALDYLADQNYTPEQIGILADVLSELDPEADIDALKDGFSGKRGVITRLRTIISFVKKYEENDELITELKHEMEYLLANIMGDDSASITF